MSALCQKPTSSLARLQSMDEHLQKGGAELAIALFIPAATPVLKPVAGAECRGGHISRAVFQRHDVDLPTLEIH